MSRCGVRRVARLDKSNHPTAKIQAISFIANYLPIRKSGSCPRTVRNLSII